MEEDMTFLGFVAFFDPPKQDVSETLKKLEDYGLEIKIITGDSELVAEKVARDIMLPTKGTLVGKAVAVLSPAQLSRAVEDTTIFARVSPEQKEQIIAALQSNKHVVGYMGDGINDAPSLHIADVGISVDNAVDIAKESADLILLKKSLADLVEGVIEGRRTFSNTVKYLMMALSSNYGNMFSMAGASLVLPFLPMLPTQILLNNLLYDISQFALPVDNVDQAELRRPQRFNLHFIKSFMLVFGPVSSVFDFLTFGLLLLVFHLGPHQFQTGWFLESIATQALVVYVIRTKQPVFWKSRPALALVLSTVCAVLAGWLIALSPLGKFFGFSTLSPLVILAILAVVVCYGAAVALAKVLFYRKWLGRRTLGEEVPT
jgi:Mg2+-importing ATPase